MRRVVIDANVLLSVTVARAESPLTLLMGAVRSAAVEMIACDQLLAEVREGLAGPYFRERITEEEQAGIPRMLRSLALMLPDPVHPPRIVRDPKDDYLVALARVAGAAAIVTGDRDLLDHAGLEPPAIDARTVCISLGLING